MIGFHDTAKECLLTLKSLKVNIDVWNIILVHRMTSEFSDELRRDYELSIENPRGTQTVTDLLKFIENQFQ